MTKRYLTIPAVVAGALALLTVLVGQRTLGDRDGRPVAARTQPAE